MSDDSFFKSPIVQNIINKSGILDREESTTDFLRDLLLGTFIDFGAGFVQALPGARREAIQGVKDNMEKAIGRDNKAWLEREPDRAKFKPFQEKGGFDADGTLSAGGADFIKKELLTDFKTNQFDPRQFGGASYDSIVEGSEGYNDVRAAEEKYVRLNTPRKEKYYRDLSQDKFVTSKHFSTIENEIINRFADELQAAENAPKDIFELIQQTIEKNHGPEVASAATLKATAATNKSFKDKQEVKKLAKQTSQGEIVNPYELYQTFGSSGNISRAEFNVQEADKVNKFITDGIKNNDFSSKFDIFGSSYATQEPDGFIRPSDDIASAQSSSMKILTNAQLKNMRNIEYDGKGNFIETKPGGKEFLNTVSNLAAIYRGKVGESIPQSVEHAIEALALETFLTKDDSDNLVFRVPKTGFDFSNISEKEALKLQGPKLYTAALNGIRKQKNELALTAVNSYEKSRYEKLRDLELKFADTKDENILEEIISLENESYEDRLIKTVKHIISPDKEYVGTKVKNPNGGEPFTLGFLNQEQAQSFLNDAEEKLEMQLPDIQKIVNELPTAQEQSDAFTNTIEEDEGGFLDSIASFFKSEPEDRIQNEIDKVQEDIRMYQEGSVTRNRLEKQLEELLSQKSLLDRNE